MTPEESEHSGWHRELQSKNEWFMECVLSECSAVSILLASQRVVFSLSLCTGEIKNRERCSASSPWSSRLQTLPLIHSRWEGKRWWKASPRGPSAAGLKPEHEWGRTGEWFQEKSYRTLFESRTFDSGNQAQESGSPSQQFIFTRNLLHMEFHTLVMQFIEMFILIENCKLITI